MTWFRSPLFSPAVLSLAIAAMFTFDANGIAWFWAGQPQGAAILLLFSAVLWILVLRTVRKGRIAQE
ncbi:hypothetical protein E3T55_19950 [Cryobacterium frigoriphilum]|uniref:Uncharacterized protein n=1 Tax=Cryobacterium frigoriphilum TaxID=1259150 RepID=A0A4R8ZTI9_9MICO|nr:hypothetical protein [Cryobacterium frigoriphilum]TFD44835.1 hypothetical protein E3T55_19950 [Cryobacterium frigoriphilum]